MKTHYNISQQRKEEIERRINAMTDLDFATVLLSRKPFKELLKYIPAYTWEERQMLLDILNDYRDQQEVKDFEETYCKNPIDYFSLN